MTKSSVAIIGTGPAGLACGHFLQHRFEVTVYEKYDDAGGRSVQVQVSCEDWHTSKFNLAHEAMHKYCHRVRLRLRSRTGQREAAV